MLNILDTITTLTLHEDGNQIFSSLPCLSAHTILCDVNLR